MDTRTKDLKSLLENVKDTYPDFVRHVQETATEYQCSEKIADFIANHADADTSDILDFVDDEICRVPKFEDTDGN